MATAARKPSLLGPKPPITRPKPRGANVRAFIENVEKGSKPKPDFFEAKPKPVVASLSVTTTTAATTGSGDDSQKEVIYAVDTGPPSEDSGHSTCDLKYSGMCP